MQRILVVEKGGWTGWRRREYTGGDEKEKRIERDRGGEIGAMKEQSELICAP